MSAASSQEAVLPSALLADPPVFFVPLFAVTSMSLNETYHLPPLTGSQQRIMVPTHDDVISLSALLIGPARFSWKHQLETMADISKLGGALEHITRGAASGLVLITSMTLRADMQIQSLAFTASASRRDVLEVQISLMHVPRPGILARALDVTNLAVQAFSDLR